MSDDRHPITYLMLTQAVILILSLWLAVSTLKTVQKTISCMVETDATPMNSIGYDGKFQIGDSRCDGVADYVPSDVADYGKISNSVSNRITQMQPFKIKHLREKVSNR